MSVLPQNADESGKGGLDSPVMTQMEVLEGTTPTFTDNSNSESFLFLN